MDTETETDVEFDTESYDEDKIMKQIKKDIKYIYRSIIEDYKDRYDCPILDRLGDNKTDDFIEYVFDNIDYSKLIQ